MVEATPPNQGAFDLSGIAAAQAGAVPRGANAGLPAQAPHPGAGGAGESADLGAPTISALLVTDVTQANLMNEMQLSSRVPVVLVLYSPKSLASQQAVDLLETVTREARGAFQLGKVDVDADPQVAAAFQAQSIPAAYAVLAGRPLPLFEGVPTRSQVQEVLDEVLRIAPELGVTARLTVEESEFDKPMPPAHQAARDAEAEGDWGKAVKAWKKVLASNPADAEAKTALARARFERRYEKELAAQTSGESAADESVSALADSMFASGDEEGAFNSLLDALTGSFDPEEKERLRKQLVGLFPIATDAAAVKSARNRLATHLMV